MSTRQRSRKRKLSPTKKLSNPTPLKKRRVTRSSTAKKSKSTTTTSRKYKTPALQTKTKKKAKTTKSKKQKSTKKTTNNQQETVWNWNEAFEELDLSHAPTTAIFQNVRIKFDNEFKMGVNGDRKTPKYNILTAEAVIIENKKFKHQKVTANSNSDNNNNSNNNNNNINNINEVYNINNDIQEIILKFAYSHIYSEMDTTRNYSVALGSTSAHEHTQGQDKRLNLRSANFDADEILKQSNLHSCAFGYDSITYLDINLTELRAKNIKAVHSKFTDEDEADYQSIIESLPPVARGLYKKMNMTGKKY